MSAVKRTALLLFMAGLAALTMLGVASAASSASAPVPGTAHIAVKIAADPAVKIAAAPAVKIFTVQAAAKRYEIGYWCGSSFFPDSNPFSASNVWWARLINHNYYYCKRGIR